MERILSEQEKQTLIGQIWSDHRGRRDTNRSYALYVSLDSPSPDLDEITKKMLGVLLKSPSFSLDWAEDWGRVVVCVGPGSELGCRLAHTKDDASKKFIPVQTTRKLEKSEVEDLLNPLPRGRSGLVLLNDQQTTIEGFLISYIHMIDELIWDIYRSVLNVGDKQNWPTLYADSVRLVQQNGFFAQLASEDEILLTRVANDRAKVRLYGSGVNKDVPKVMGVVEVHNLVFPTF